MLQRNGDNQVRISKSFMPEIYILILRNDQKKKACDHPMKLFVNSLSEWRMDTRHFFIAIFFGLQETYCKRQKRRRRFIGRSGSV